MSGRRPRPMCGSLPITNTYKQTQTRTQIRTIIQRQYYYGNTATIQRSYEYSTSKTILQGRYYKCYTSGGVRWYGVEGGHTAILVQSSYNLRTVLLQYYHSTSRILLQKYYYSTTTYQCPASIDELFECSRYCMTNTT
jgi:hypothetical protein